MTDIQHEKQARINKLQELIDFFTTQKVNLLAQQKAKKFSIENFSNLIEPTFILTQSAVLAMNQAYNEIETNIIANLNKIFLSLNDRFENIIISYIRIIQLGIDIQKDRESKKYLDQMKRYEDNLAETKHSQPKLITSLNDTLVMDLNIEIDEAFIKFDENYRNILKIWDSFQLKITQFHNILSDFPNISSELSVISNIAQDLEEVLTDFKRHLHLDIESIVYKQILNFEKILNNILNGSTSNLNSQADLLENFEEQYNSNKELIEQLKNKLEIYISEYFTENSEKLDDILKRISENIDDCFNSIRSIHFSEDEQLIVEIKQLDDKIAEYEIKLQNVNSP